MTLPKKRKSRSTVDKSLPVNIPILKFVPEGVRSDVSVVMMPDMVHGLMNGTKTHFCRPIAGGLPELPAGRVQWKEDGPGTWIFHVDGDVVSDDESVVEGANDMIIFMCGWPPGVDFWVREAYRPDPRCYPEKLKNDWRMIKELFLRDPGRDKILYRQRQDPDYQRQGVVYGLDVARRKDAERLVRCVMRKSRDTQMRGGLPVDAKLAEYDLYAAAAGPKWWVAYHMLFPLSRLFLRVKRVEILRVQDITEKQARKEGLLPDPDSGSCRDAFMYRWDERYFSKGFGWDDNPIIQRVEFRTLGVLEDE